MVKFYCDKCGKELKWAGSITPSNTIADLRTMSQEFNTDGYKTYDPIAGKMLDLCGDCKNKLAMSLWDFDMEPRHKFNDL